MGIRLNSLTTYASAIIAACVIAPQALAGATMPRVTYVMDFETEDDFVTPLIPGQIVDNAFDPTDPEFGRLFSLERVFTSPDRGSAFDAQALTLFDSNPNRDLTDVEDTDLLVDLGNVLILQNNEKRWKMTDPDNGLFFVKPDDHAQPGVYTYRFNFTQEVRVESIDLIDIDNGVELDILVENEDGGNFILFDVGNNWTNDISKKPATDGYQTLDLVSTLEQAAEAGAIGDSVTGGSSLGFDKDRSVSLTITARGTNPSFAIDNLVFSVPIPEPSLGLLLLAGTPMLARRRRG